MFKNSTVTTLARNAVEKWMQPGTEDYLVKAYSEPHRHYHTLNHIEKMLLYALWFMERHEGKMEDIPDALVLAILFHDVVYQPRRSDNEIRSAMAFRAMSVNAESIMEEVITLIGLTATHEEPQKGWSEEVILKADLAIFTEPLAMRIEYEKQIFKEFQFVPYTTYREKRVEVLNKYAKITKIDQNDLIAYVQTRTPKIGIYAGSFNPFHIGHLDILRQAETMFDKVIVAIGNNAAKEENVISFTNITHLKESLHNEIQVIDKSLAGTIREYEYPLTLIRGMRDSHDLREETNLGKMLKEMNPDINIVYLLPSANVSHVSSSAIRQLRKISEKEAQALASRLTRIKD